MPQRTIALLDRLEPAGFRDAEFRIIHHMPQHTLQAHRNYCAKTATFQGEQSNNTLVRQRLELIASSFFIGGFTCPARDGVLEALATAALREIPHS